MSEPATPSDTRNLQILKLYIKDVSFESPMTPGIFQAQWNPQLDLKFNMETKKLDETNFEVTLGVTATATNDKGQAAFLVELQQAGIFLIEGFNESEMDHLTKAYCPNILFPFAREAIADLSTRGGFPPLVLQPVNFDAMYAQQKKGANGGAAH
jgi:preprotein translocase subunit SecB